MLCQILPPQHMFSTDGLERVRKEEKATCLEFDISTKVPKRLFCKCQPCCCSACRCSAWACGLSPDIINWLIPTMFTISCMNLFLFSQSALEGKLSKLRRHLFAMRQTLSLTLAPGQGSSETAHHILPTAVYARLINQAAQCHRSAAECCSDLLTLTLLVPSAPWVSILFGMLGNGLHSKVF